MYKVMPIYEIKLDGETIELTLEMWDTIRQKVRSNKWFYLIYKNKKYKYTKDKEFLDRSTLFCFESLKDGEEEEIEILVLNNEEVIQ